jgi:hypothetical protein
MTRKGGLGKGLEALIPGETSPSSQAGSALQVQVTRIVPNPLQHRLQMDASD